VIDNSARPFRRVAIAVLIQALVEAARLLTPPGKFVKPYLDTPKGSPMPVDLHAKLVQWGVANPKQLLFNLREAYSSGGDPAEFLLSDSIYHQIVGVDPEAFRPLLTADKAPAILDILSNRRWGRRSRS